jgi:hypothetical protein
MKTMQIGTVTLSVEQAYAHHMSATARRASLEAGRGKRVRSCSTAVSPLCVVVRRGHRLRCDGLRAHAADARGGKVTAPKVTCSGMRVSFSTTFWSTDIQAMHNSAPGVVAWAHRASSAPPSAASTSPSRRPLRSTRGDFQSVRI